LPASRRQAFPAEGNTDEVDQTVACGRFEEGLRRAVRGFWLLPILTLLPALVAHADDRTALIRMVRQDCGSCHGMTLKGGLGTPLTAQALSEKPGESLVATILYGRPGTAMPAWKTILSESDAQWIVGHLQEGFPEERR
jgi:cytochrome c55X